MLLCAIDDISPGMKVAAAVMHPQRPEMELVKPGLALNENLLGQLKRFGVERAWVDHDATADMDKKIKLGPSPAHRAAYERLKGSIRDLSAKTISAGDMLAYRQVVMDMVCELMGNPALATLTERLSHAGEGAMFRHGANVAYLSVLVGLQMECYIIQQRGKLAPENAKDLTALGIGAMLHDVGKIAEPSAEVRRLDVLAIERKRRTIAPGDTHAEESLKATVHAYQRHADVGYQLLEKANAPASARQVVLTHHQRWDGLGFPEMDHVTRGRQRGTQSGEQIHIFSRIVAAADLLDHLLAEAREARRPEIAALSAFHDKAFESWMDPIVRDAVLRTIPPFPIASHVRLSDGRAAVVIAPNPVQPCLPTLRLLDKDDELGEPFALTEHRDITITHLVGEPVEDHIFLLPEQEALAKSMLARTG